MILALDSLLGSLQLVYRLVELLLVDWLVEMSERASASASASASPSSAAAKIRPLLASLWGNRGHNTVVRSVSLEVLGVE